MSLTLPPSADSGAIFRQTVVADKTTGKTLTLEMGIENGQVFAFALGDLIISDEGMTRISAAIQAFKVLAAKAGYTLKVEPA